jgi:hypothetical protein
VLLQFVKLCRGKKYEAHDARVLGQRNDRDLGPAGGPTQEGEGEQRHDTARVYSSAARSARPAITPHTGALLETPQGRPQDD